MKNITYIALLALFSVSIVQTGIKGTVFRKFNTIRSKIISFFSVKKAQEPVKQQKEAVVEKYVPFKTTENFNSIAGSFSAKEDLQEIINVFNNPEKYKNAGIKLPRGIILFGDLGTGKTTIARAIAGEINRPFFMISGEIAE